ncbi:MAG: hypothetical protein R3E95_20440 [Thiolinea sp.]
MTSLSGCQNLYTAETYSTYTPWNSNTESRIGTGFIIEATVS